MTGSSAVVAGTRGSTPSSLSAATFVVVIAVVVVVVDCLLSLLRSSTEFAGVMGNGAKAVGSCWIVGVGAKAVGS